MGGPCKAFAMQTTLQFAHRIGGEDCTKLLMRLRKTMCAVLWCLLCFMFHALFQGGVCESESSLGRCRWFLHVSTAPFTYMHVDLGAELGNCPRRLGHKQTKCVSPYAEFKEKVFLETATVVDSTVSTRGQESRPEVDSTTRSFCFKQCQTVLEREKEWRLEEVWDLCRNHLSM
ncbi:unnamed protein product [Durusdinium trenchii]|uniref:Uncharacterized protein n=1 Tax=Durusdinium trenchii TaxID=1381693 RepID=A0ABP0QBE5_9DINO